MFAILGLVLGVLIVGLLVELAIFADDDSDAVAVIAGSLCVAVLALLSLLGGIERRSRFIYDRTSEALEAAATSAESPEAVVRQMRETEAALLQTGAYGEAARVADARRDLERRLAR